MFCVCFFCFGGAAWCGFGADFCFASVFLFWWRGLVWVWTAAIAAGQLAVGAIVGSVIAGVVAVAVLLYFVVASDMRQLRTRRRTRAAAVSPHFPFHDDGLAASHSGAVQRPTSPARGPLPTQTRGRSRSRSRSPGARRRQGGHGFGASSPPAPPFARAFLV